ncbi:hypothetical protein JCM3775_000613 [Rhodotorula graminis]
MGAPKAGLDGKTTGAAILLAVVLVAYTIQTELASHVQHQLGYKKPFFLFYLTHSGYTLLVPAHVLVLRLTGTPIRSTFADLRDLLAYHFRTPSPHDDPDGAAIPVSPKVPRSRSDRSLYRHTSPNAVTRYLPAALADIAEQDWVQNLAKKAGILTIFISAPALSWYAAVPLTSMTDITAIYNVFAFWAYLLSLYYLPSPASARESPSHRLFNLLSVVLAVCGVFVIAYGDATGSSDGEGANRLIGNGLALFGSIAYAGYEVWYKIHIALPDSTPDDQPLTPILPVHQRQSSHRPLPAHGAPSPSSAARAAGTPDTLAAAIDDLDSRPASDSDDDNDDDREDRGPASETSSLLNSPVGTPTRLGSPVGGHSSNLSSSSRAAPPPTRPRLGVPRRLSHAATSPRPPRASPTLFLLYSNVLTSLIGLCTLLFLWIPIPLLQLVGWEDFEWPPVEARWALAGIIASGVVFNGGFMLLISLLGPVIASVANLLTLILVAAADALFVPSAPPITRSTLLGGGMIVTAFAGLIAGEVRSHHQHAKGRAVGEVDER